MDKMDLNKEALSKEEIISQIMELKKEKDAVILAHYYVDGDVQAIADFVGDSYFLAQKATQIPQKVILFCGVSFMGESAKILNPEKTVVMADDTADCPMAHMVDIDKINEVRAKYDDVAVVCYVNSTAEIKAASDVCVTSSNAVRIVKRLPNKHIFFIPDNNLGRFVAKQVPDKEFIFNDGFCHVHKSIHSEDILKAKELHPDALVLAHPECTEDALELVDFIGSTSEIIDYVTSSDKEVFIICTEMGIFYELMQKNPNKKFYSVGHRQFCPNMKKVSLSNVLTSLETLANPVELDEQTRLKANVPLKRMLELAAK
jgi:quinolinate synthase